VNHARIDETRPGLRPATLAVAWALGIGIVVFVRHRAQWDAYTALHRWAADQGVPDWARAFDGLLLYLAAAVLCAWVIARWWGVTVTGGLGLRRGQPGWALMALVALLPMVVGGLVLGVMRGGTLQAEALMPKVLSGVVRAPIAEEVLFRGLLIGVCAVVVGWGGPRFWANALAAASLFALTHVQWNPESIAAGWPTLLVTGLGGLWYAWLLARWRSLWVPMLLHAGMNLGWLLAGAGGGAGGGGWIENVLRVATIATATWWTVRKGRAQEREIGPPVTRSRR
jgi:membrane protease YdiL (CAAX protease family)